MIYHSKTGHVSPVLEWLTIMLTFLDPNHLKTGHFCPFFNCLDHLNTGLYKVWYSDESGIWMSGIQMDTVLFTIFFAHNLRPGCPSSTRPPSCLCLSTVFRSCTRLSKFLQTNMLDLWPKLFLRPLEVTRKLMSR